jgi:hypothetical protein
VSVARSGGLFAREVATAPQITPRSNAMRRSLKSSTLAAALALSVAALGAFASTASASFQLGCDAARAPMHCFVIEPNVRQKATTYPQIQFEAGNRVFIEAGGCVQTGGHGKTWKRYVDPASDSDLYHGLIGLPGYVDRRLQGLVGTQVFVAEAGPLVLGYEDNNFGDNGYYARNSDNGTGNQCLGLGNAWVRLSIT